MCNLPVDLTEPRPDMSRTLLELLHDCFGLIPSSEPKDLGGSFSLNIVIDTPAGRYTARVHGTQTGLCASKPFNWHAANLPLEACPLQNQC